MKKVVALIDPSSGYERALLHGIGKYARLHGPWNFYCEPPYYTSVSRKQLEIASLREWHPDGIIAHECNRVEDLITLKVPLIVSPCSFLGDPQIPAICTDDRLVGEMAAEHLLRRGFRVFLYCGFQGFRWTQGRLQGFAERIAQGGGQVETHFYRKRRPKRAWLQEQESLANRLCLMPKPLAVMAANDDMGQLVCEACKVTGLKVPEEVSVLGVDNDTLMCDMASPPLSSVALNPERVGFEAGALLDRLMAGEVMSGERIIDHPTHVVARQSTGNLAIADPLVAEAVHFIQKNWRKRLTVSELASHVAVSRRALERRFRRTIQHSVLDEIHAVQANHISQMLIETDMPIKQIADIFGGPDFKYMLRWFRKVTGMTPKMYRMRYGRK